MMLSPRSSNDEEEDKLEPQHGHPREVDRPHATVDRVARSRRSASQVSPDPVGPSSWCGGPALRPIDAQTQSFVTNTRRLHEEAPGGTPGPYSAIAVETTDPFSRPLSASVAGRSPSVPTPYASSTVSCRLIRSVDSQRMGKRRCVGGTSPALPVSSSFATRRRSTPTPLLSTSPFHMDWSRPDRRPPPRGQGVTNLGSRDWRKVS